MTGPQTGRGRSEKGARAERDFVRWLNDWRGIPAQRNRSGNAADPGDVSWPDSPWHIDCKDQQRWRIPEWWAEVNAEAGDRSPVLVIKVPGEVDPSRWIAVMRVKDVDW